MAFENRRIYLHPSPNGHGDHIASLDADLVDLTRLGDDPLGEEKAGGQVAVVAGRPHGDRDFPGGSASRHIGGEADLQRFLHRKRVREPNGRRTNHFLRVHADNARARLSDCHAIPSLVEAFVSVTPAAATSIVTCFMSGWSLWALKSPIGHNTFSSGM